MNHHAVALLKRSQAALSVHLTTEARMRVFAALIS